MKRILSVAAALAFSTSNLFISSGAAAQVASIPATNQAAVNSTASSAVGHWVYNQQGDKIGSVRSLTDNGETAVIMVGSYFQPGSHEARISANALSIVNGNVTLRNDTLQALNTVSRR